MTKWGWQAVKYGFIAAAMSAAFAIVAVNPAAAVDPDTPSPTQVFRAALDAYNAGDCAKATSLVAPLIQGGPAIAGADQANAFDLAITCALKEKNLARAGDYAYEATGDYDAMVAAFAKGAAIPRRWHVFQCQPGDQSRGEAGNFWTREGSARHASPDGH